jgi:hypothetical protein
VHMEEFCYFCKTELYFTVQDKTVFKEILVWRFVSYLLVMIT